MELMELFKMGATMIESNSDKATTGLDIDSISNALNGLMSDSNGGLNLSSLMGNLSQNGLGEIVGSWLGNGDNKSISASQITELLGADKISEFASMLGLSEDSAKDALSQSVPNIVDKATTGERSIIEEMMGGSNGAMDMLSKMFR